MDRVTSRILRAIAKDGEVSLYDAVRLAPSKRCNHIDQYPLALLIEDDYVGTSVAHTPIPHMDALLSRAIGLHIWRLREGVEPIEYLGISSSGGLDTRKERVFLKAKGALYLSAQHEKRWDRFYSILIATFVAVLSATLTALFTGHLTRLLRSATDGV